MLVISFCHFERIWWERFCKNVVRNSKISLFLVNCTVLTSVSCVFYINMLNYGTKHFFKKATTKKIQTQITIHYNDIITGLIFEICVSLACSSINRTRVVLIGSKYKLDFYFFGFYEI